MLFILIIIPLKMPNSDSLLNNFNYVVSVPLIDSVYHSWRDVQIWLYMESLPIIHYIFLQMN